LKQENKEKNRIVGIHFGQRKEENKDKIMPYLQSSI